MNKTIGLIGAGNMANAIVKGFVNNFTELKNKIYVYDCDTDKANNLCNLYGIKSTKGNIEIVEKCNIIVLAVKPNVLSNVLNEIKGSLTKDKIVISIAAGITINNIQQYSHLPLKIIRMMPNMPVSIGYGMVAVAINKHVNESELKDIITLFSAIGKVDIINESLMNMIPAVSGSSPAFVYMFIEALADGAVLQGMSREKAYKYAAQAVLGSAKMVLEAHKHPGELKDMVCSPAGTTIEAVYSLEKSGFRGSIIEAMNICTAKTEKMCSMS